jgi:hypothetical protein
MPAKPSYARRLAAAMETLQARQTPWIGRADVEELLGVSKTVAWRLLRHCEAQKGPGGALLLERVDLIAKLQELATAGGTIAQEVARRQKVEDQLLAMHRYLRSRETKVVRDEQAEGLVSSRFRSLPPNITFTPQSLLIEFAGTEHFLAAIGAIVYALENDYEAISDFIEAAC